MVKLSDTVSGATLQWEYSYAALPVSECFSILVLPVSCGEIPDFVVSAHVVSTGLEEKI